MSVIVFNNLSLFVNWAAAEMPLWLTEMIDRQLAVIQSAIKEKQDEDVLDDDGLKVFFNEEKMAFELWEKSSDEDGVMHTDLLVCQESLGEIIRYLNDEYGDCEFPFIEAHTALAIWHSDGNGDAGSEWIWLQEPPELHSRPDDLAYGNKYVAVVAEQEKVLASVRQCVKDITYGDMLNALEAFDHLADRNVALRCLSDEHLGLLTSYTENFPGRIFQWLEDWQR